MKCKICDLEAREEEMEETPEGKICILCAEILQLYIEELESGVDEEEAMMNVLEIIRVRIQGVAS